jgi:hypothetical protein
MGQIATSLYRKFERNRSKGLEAYSELLNLNKGSPSRRVKGVVTCSSLLYLYTLGILIEYHSAVAEKNAVPFTPCLCPIQPNFFAFFLHFSCLHFLE